MSNIVRRRQPITEAGNINKPSTSTNKPKNENLKRQEVNRINWHRIVALASCIMCVIFVFSVGVIVGSMFQYDERHTCSLKIPESIQPKLSIWNGENDVGSIVWQYCTYFSNAPIHRLYVCSWEFYWMLLLDFPCECPKDPHYLPKTSAVMEWNQKHDYFTVIIVKCSSHNESAVALKLICNNNRIWEVSYEGSCDCPDLGSSSVFIKDLNNPLTRYQIGCDKVEYCSWMDNSPSYRALVCDSNSKWLVLEELNDCECFIDAPIDPRWRTKWSSTFPSKLIGTEVLSLCTEEPSSAILQIYQCDVDKKWKSLISPEDSSCESHIKILPVNTFYASTIICKQYNGVLKTLSNWEERYELAISLRYLRQQCPIDLFFIGVFEEVNSQWTVDSVGLNTFELNVLWDSNYPNNVSNKCVVITTAGSLQNKNCKSYSTCFMCHKEGRFAQVTIINESVTINEARKNCSQQQMKLLSVRTKQDVDNLFANVKKVDLTCPDYFTDIINKGRIWKDINQNRIPTPHWINGEPSSFDKDCVAISESGKYMQWEPVSCGVPACGICSQFYTAK